MSIVARPITARPLTALRIGEELSAGGGLYGDAFVLVMETTTAAETVTIPCFDSGTFNATIDWGDETTSTITAYNDADLAHEYATAGEYTIQITGDFPNIQFNNGGDRLKLKKILNIGDTGLTQLANAFRGCANLTELSRDGNVNTSGVNNMTNLLNGCSSLVTTDFSGFDTSSVTDMGSLFFGCSSLTGVDLSGFDTSSVQNLTSMFRSCSNLISVDLSGFDTSSVTAMTAMFFFCPDLVTADLSSFDTSGVASFQDLFRSCSSLTSVPIAGWDITSLTSAVRMLNGANNALTTAEYDAVLVAWEAQVYNNTVTADFGDATYTAGSAAATARAQLITDGWTITDGGSV